MKYEKICDSWCRLKVPNGWMVVCTGYKSMTSQFIIDPKHEWKLEPQNEKTSQ